MKSQFLVLITSDPRTSPKPAEAVRIAAGVGSWGKVAVMIYLRAPAARVLSEFPDELVDGENFTRFLPLVAESGGLVLVQRDAPALAEIGRAPVPFREIGDEELADLAARNDYVARF